MMLLATDKRRSVRCGGAGSAQRHPPRAGSSYVTVTVKPPSATGAPLPRPDLDVEQAERRPVLTAGCSATGRRLPAGVDPAMLAAAPGVAPLPAAVGGAGRPRAPYRRRMTALCRRSLLKGAAVTCGTGLLAACGSGSGAEPASAPSAAGPDGAAAGSRVTLGQLSDIPVGGAISVSAPDGSKVLLTQPRAGEVKAFSAVCPHEGCSASPDGDHFSCPCHGSEFELDGSLRQGPAREGLSSYDVRVVDGQVLPA